MGRVPHPWRSLPRVGFHGRDPLWDLSDDIESRRDYEAVPEPALPPFLIPPDSPAPLARAPRPGLRFGGCSKIPTMRNTPSIGTLKETGYCSFAYSALASFRIGMSWSASFHVVKKF